MDTKNVSSASSNKISPEDQTLDSGNEAEEISEAFLCCVCPDLLYKPIVLGCGHISCFWCVLKSMDSWRESYCLVCRHPYTHFPHICQLLHFLLLKLYPVAYKKREKQVLEEEKVGGCFSPQFGDHSIRSNTMKASSFLVNPPPSTTFSSHPDLHSNFYYSGEVKSSSTVESSKFVTSLHNNATTVSEETSTGNSETCKNVDFEGDFLKNEASNQVSVLDLPCASCSQLIFQPVVLNCGHVLCESCIVTPEDEMLKCEVCESLHQEGFPKVCVGLDHFVEEQFPKEYSMRRDAINLKKGHRQYGSLPTCATQAGKQDAEPLLSPTKDYLSWWRKHGSKDHIGVGCDSCGLFPIVGERYRCKDCVELIGFDLCGACYNARSMLPGRFNQQHTPEHGFELVRSNLIQNIMLPMAFESEDSSAAPLLSDNSSEDLEVSININHILSLSHPEGPENCSSTLIPSDNASEDSEGTHSMI